jgi:hypothetical protein
MVQSARGAVEFMTHNSQHPVMVTVVFANTPYFWTPLLMFNVTAAAREKH